MRDQPHVGLVDPHAKGIGGDHDPDPSVEESSEERTTGFARQSGMIGRGGKTPASQDGRDSIGPIAGRQVDDRALPDTAQQAAEDRQARALDLVPFDREGEVRPVEGAGDGDRVSQAEYTGNVGAGVGSSGGGESQDWRAPECPVEAANGPVMGPELVAPLTYAVSFVYGQE